MSEKWKNLVIAKPEDGTFTQEFTDQSFKFWFDTMEALNSVQNEVESFKHAAYKDKKEKIEKLKEYISSNLKTKIENKQKEEAENPPLKAVKSKMEVIKPLTEPPSSIDGVVNYCTNVATYFLGPYKSLVNCTIFYSEYAVKMGETIKQTLDLLTNTLSLLESELAAVEANKFTNGESSITKEEEYRAALENNVQFISRYNE